MFGVVRCCLGSTWKSMASNMMTRVITLSIYKYTQIHTYIYIDMLRINPTYNH